MKILNSLWIRLTLAFTLVILVAVGAIAILINHTTGTEFRQYITHSGMRASGSGMEQLVAFYERQNSWDGVENLFAEGFLVSGSMPGMPHWPGMATGRLEVMLADADARIVFDSTAKSTGKRLRRSERTGALPIIDSNGQETIGYLVLSMPNRGKPDVLGTLEERFLERMQSVLLAGAATAVVLGLIAGALLSRSLTAPLQRLAAAARAVGSGDLDRRVETTGSAEIAKVGQAFNEMTAALEEAEQLRRNLMADVAHELRTPLSVLQGNLRAILDDIYPLEKVEIARLYDETRLLSRLVGDLRELALAEAGQLGLNLQSTDAGEAIRVAVANFEPAAESGMIQLSSDVPPGLPPVMADPDRLAQVLRNLLINALRHTAKGGQISVSAAAVEDAVEIAVTDDGEGIAPQDLPHVFDRFWRAEPSRSRAEGGAGLGLAIVRAIVETHGGQVSAASDGPGQGSTFRFTLPLS